MSMKMMPDKRLKKEISLHGIDGTETLIQMFNKSFICKNLEVRFRCSDC